MYDIVYDIARYDVVYDIVYDKSRSYVLHDIVYDISRYDVVYDIVYDFLYLGLVAWLYPTLGVQMFASCCFHSCLHFFFVSVRIRYISPFKILVWTLYIIFDMIYIYIYCTLILKRNSRWNWAGNWNRKSLERVVQSELVKVIQVWKIGHKTRQRITRSLLVSHRARWSVLKV